MLKFGTHKIIQQIQSTVSGTEEEAKLGMLVYVEPHHEWWEPSQQLGDKYVKLEKVAGEMVGSVCEVESMVYKPLVSCVIVFHSRVITRLCALFKLLVVV